MRFACGQVLVTRLSARRRAAVAIVLLRALAIGDSGRVPS
jgi:hypothetical protein